MNKKREAPAASAAEMGNSKKRKMDGQKFYGVRVGFNPGVYTVWADVEKTIKGFRDASFKKFSKEEDAQAFVDGKDVFNDNDKAKSKYKKFYAVAVGHATGIFTSWEEAKPLTEGVKGPKYKGFGTRAEAVAFIKQFGNREAIEALGDEEEENEPPAKKTRTGDNVDRNGRSPKNAIAKDSDVLVIYTDGSSLANGKKGSRAGVGVFFGTNDPRNISERLNTEPQTNQRAELTAIQRALEVAPLTQKVQICTDSQYSINCVTQWAASWERKGWKTAAGAEVKNQDIIRKVLAKMKERTEAGSETYFQWVKGHAADTSNIAADRLAVQGANMAL